MDEWFYEQYEDYLVDFEAWGHEYHDKPLTFEQYEELRCEQDDIMIAEECGHLTKTDRARRDEIERQLLTHACYFENGPRVTVVMKSDLD